MSVFASLTQWLQGLFGSNAGTKPPADDEALTSMLAQRITILQSRLATAKANVEAGKTAEIDALEVALQGPKSWNTANLVELRLLDIMPEASLRPSLQATLQDGRVLDAGLPAGLLGAAEATLKDGEATGASQRILLHAIVEQVQWVETKKYRLRRLTTQIANTVLYWALFSTIAFSFAILVPLLAHNFDGRQEANKITTTIAPPALVTLTSTGSVLLSQAGPPAPVVTPATVGTPEPAKIEIALLERPFGLIWAFMFGIMGANLSILYFFRDRVSTMSIEEAEWNAKWYVPVTKLLIGGLGAVVVYFFLRSEIVTGLIAPNFAALGFSVHDTSKSASGSLMALPEKILIPSADLAKLAIWSLIAGTSESFVPSVLRETEQKLSARTGKTTQ